MGVRGRSLNLPLPPHSSPSARTMSRASSIPRQFYPTPPTRRALALRLGRVISSTIYASPASPQLVEDLRSIIDAADGIGQTVSGGERRGRGVDRGRHEDDSCVEAQERNPQEARAHRRLNEPPLGQASAPINPRRQCDRSRDTCGPTPPHESASIRRRSDEMAALPAVTAATPPTTRAAFKSVPPCRPLRTASSESLTASRRRSGSLLGWRRLKIALRFWSAVVRLSRSRRQAHPSSSPFVPRSRSSPRA